MRRKVSELVCNRSGVGNAICIAQCKEITHAYITARNNKIYNVEGIH